MALSKLFERIFWHNNTTPAINEDNLNAMSKAIDDIDDRVIAIGDDVLTVIPQIQSYLEQAEDLVEAMEALSENPPYIGANGNWYTWNTEAGEYTDSGVDASITVDIADITMLSYGATPYVTNTGTDTDPVFHLFIPRAAGIASIAKTGTSGLVDTYTITFDDGNTTTFNVTNGADGASDWSNVNNKPFSSIGAGLSVESNALKADVQNIGLSNTGTASATGVNFQYLVKNGSTDVGTIRGSMYMQQDNVQLSTSQDVTITFTNASILATSVVDVYTSNPDISYKTMSISAGSCSITFPQQSSAITIDVRIYIK